MRSPFRCRQPAFDLSGRSGLSRNLKSAGRPSHFAALVLLLCAANAFNVVNSYVGRNFMTAIADRDVPGFAGKLLSMSASSPRDPYRRDRSLRRGAARAPVARHDDPRDLAPLSCRRNLSTPQRLGSDRQSRPAHLRRRSRLHGHDAVLRAHGAQSAFTIVAFSGVLWTISPLLFGVAVLYAAIGSFFTFVFGRPLID